MTPGTRLGPYEIVAPIGSGGMGDVYRARDTRLGRDVAIKISAEHFSDRFAREARAIAALNHPHICTLHDVGPNYLVMELIEGETLADRLRAGALAANEALRIARQIADALQAAHDRGIVHRDLKPANVKITPDGRVKVLDFGVAKLDDSESPAPAPPHDLPTEPPTRVGTIVGTAAYMAPEQARGVAVDKRADIWAFGVVLFEMVTGRRPFAGETASDTIAAILTAEPPLDTVPARMRALVQRCLEKDPKRRLRDIGDLDLLLDAAAVTTPARRSWMPWAVAAVLLATLGPVAVRHLRERPPAVNPIRFQIPHAENLAASGNIGLSPDGRYLAFLAVGDDGRVRLYVRTMDSLDVRVLEGSEVAAHAPPFFWSRDSRFIAFDAGGALKKLNISGGPAQTLCELSARTVGGSWNQYGDIILGTVSGGILRVSDAGGTATEITRLNAKEDRHLLPTFLPDGRHFVYVRVSQSRPELGGIYVGSLDVSPGEQGAQKIVPYATGLTYVPSATGPIGRLLFVQDGNLMAQPFDHDRRMLAGEAILVAERVGVYLNTAFFSASSNNVLVYRTVSPDLPLTWIDRQGNTVGQAADPAQYGSIALSPDGTRAAVSRFDARDTSLADIWLLDLTRGGAATRFTPAMGGLAESPIWSSDGKRVVFRSAGPSGIIFYEKSVDVPQDDAIAIPDTVGGGLKIPTSWSPDNAFMMVAHSGGSTLWDLWLVPVGSKAGKSLPFANTRFSEDEARFSPDGKWVAYSSNESGTKDIYVRRFLSDGGRTSASVGAGIVVSRGGGSAPRWRRDGKELFYLSATGVMMSVDVEAGETFRAGTPTPLFQAPANAIVGDVTADGKRFLFGQRGTAPFTVVMNWMTEQ